MSTPQLVIDTLLVASAVVYAFTPSVTKRHESSLSCLAKNLAWSQGGNQAALQQWVPKGAKIVEADFEDEASLVAALKGECLTSALEATLAQPYPGLAHHAFLIHHFTAALLHVSIPFLPGLAGLDIVVSAVGTPGLAAQPSVIKAAKAAGVRRFVPSEFGMDTGAPGVR